MKYAPELKRPLLIDQFLFLTNSRFISIIGNNYLIAPIGNQIASLFGYENIFVLLELPDKLYNLMTIGLGGYVVGRSAEKIIPQIAETKALISSGTTPEQLEEKKVKKAQLQDKFKKKHLRS